MFTFEKFPIYIKTEKVLIGLQTVFKNYKVDINLRDQLHRSSSSILLNFAEGSGKLTKKDRKNFYIIARGSAQESAAIIRILKIENNINEDLYLKLSQNLDEISRMLSGLIKSLK